MTRTWNGTISIDTICANVSVTISEPTSFHFGNWYGSGVIVSGSQSDLFKLFTENRTIDTDIGSIVIDNIKNSSCNSLSFTFQGSGKSLV